MARLVKRGKKWQYEISYKKPDGSFTKMRKSGFATKGEASAAAAEMELNLLGGYQPIDKDKSLYDYFKEWSELYKKNKVSDVTYSRYQNTLSNINKYFGDISIGKLTRNKYQKVLNEFSETHAKATTKRFHTHLKACLTDALADKTILNDVTYKAIITGAKETKPSNAKFLNYEEFKLLMKETEHRLNPIYSSPYMILVAGTTGLRFSELLGLTWSDIDFNSKEINVNKTWQYKTGGGFGPTKNETSNRTVDVDDHTLNILKKYKLQQKELLFANNIKNEYDLVFYNLSNGPITPDAANKTLRKIQKQVGIKKPITFHGLRHTHASILLYRNLDILVVSERLGHKNTSITQEVYAHVLDEMRIKNRSKIVSEIESLYA